MAAFAKGMVCTTHNKFHDDRAEYKLSNGQGCRDSLAACQKNAYLYLKPLHVSLQKYNIPPSNKLIFEAIMPMILLVHELLSFKCKNMELVIAMRKFMI